MIGYKSWMAPSHDTNSSIMKDLRRVCMIITIQGFQVKNRFFPREVGIIDWKGTCTYRKYKMPYDHEELTSRDKELVNFQEEIIHGLRFQSGSDDSRDISCLNNDIMQLYLSSRRKNLDVVAYRYSDK